mmetsp:Transcript_81253/g.180787  ORF Transcript_81253/g.180787 Transcript_81253/m.180787 type:complete len:335 (+) Transcript_81253:1735-2739(+)
MALHALLDIVMALHTLAQFPQCSVPRRRLALQRLVEALESFFIHALLQRCHRRLLRRGPLCWGVFRQLPPHLITHQSLVDELQGAIYKHCRDRLARTAGPGSRTRLTAALALHRTGHFLSQLLVELGQFLVEMSNLHTVCINLLAKVLMHLCQADRELLVLCGASTQIDPYFALYRRELGLQMHLNGASKRCLLLHEGSYKLLQPSLCILSMGRLPYDGRLARFRLAFHESLQASEKLGVTRIGLQAQLFPQGMRGRPCAWSCAHILLIRSHHYLRAQLPALCRDSGHEATQCGQWPRRGTGTAGAMPPHLLVKGDCGRSHLLHLRCEGLQLRL